uniref:Uncharacterized protein n=1 Tax=Salmo trutta TaxID=8032 RepID=A0A674CAA7_SALTR
GSSASLCAAAAAAAPLSDNVYLPFMAAGEGAQLPATIAASRCVEKSLEEAAGSGALNLSNRKLKEFPRTARNYDLSDITAAGELF